MKEVRTMTDRSEVVENPTMFHYLLELHQDGKSLARLEMDVPVAAFPVAKANSILTLETLLISYGESMGWKAREKAAEVDPVLPTESSG